MLVLPVVARELLIQARRKSTYWIRVCASTVAGFLLLWILLVSASPIPTVSQGKTLFSILSTLAFVYCLLIGPLVTADCLSAEKRDGTLRLLFLTDLKGYDVVLGKLVSSSLHCAYGLLVVVPMMSLALLFGGVSAGEIARMALVLANTLFLSLATGLFASTLSQNDRKAAFATVLLLFIVAAGPYELGYVMANNWARGTPFGIIDEYLTPSPIYAFTLVQSASGTFLTWAFYSSLAQTHAVAWGLLGLACVMVTNVGRDRPIGQRQEQWRKWSRRMSLGSESQRVAFRRRLLALNPCFWLSSRERHKARLVWFLLGSMTFVGLWICGSYRAVFYETSLVLLLVLQVMLKIWFIGETCHRWVEDRQNGALELLLCAPLQTRELLRGQGMALWRQFGWPVVVTVGLTVSSWAYIAKYVGSGSNTQFGRTWLLMSIPALLADLTAARWVGAWLALRAHGLNRAMAGTMARVLWLRWLVFLFCAGIAHTWQWLGFGQLRFLEQEYLWLMLVLPLDMLFGWSARRKFLRYFRAIAANPSEYRNVTQVAASVEEPNTRPARSTVQSQVEIGRAKRKMKLVALAVVMFIMLALPAGYRYWLNHQVTSRIWAAERAGLLVTLEELDRRRPLLTNGVNAAEIMTRSFPQLVMWYRLPAAVQENLPGIRGSVLPVHNEPLPQAMKEAIHSLLSTNQNALDIIHAAPSLRMGRYAMDLKSSSGLFSTQLQSINTVSLLLQFEVILRAEEEDAAGALNTLHRLFDLGHSLDREPWIIYQRMRTLCMDKAFTAMEWLLARQALPELELKALQNEVEAAEDSADFKLELMGLRCLAVDWYRSSVTALVSAGPTMPAMEQFRIQLRQRIYGLTGGKDRAIIQYLDALNEFTYLSTVSLPERFYRARKLAAKYEKLSAEISSTPLFAPKYVFERLIGPDAELVVRCRAASTSLAIEQYRRRQAGRLPDIVEELVPSFLGAVPLDPFDEKPIRYKRLTKGYCVYSVGKNGLDETKNMNELPAKTKSVDPRDDIAFIVER